VNLATLLRDAPVKRKLLYIVALSLVTAALFAVSAAIVGQWFVTRAEMKADLISHARILGTNVKSALLFGDRAEAERTLGALLSIRDVEFAEVHDRQGMPFAVYVRPGGVPPAFHHQVQVEQFSSSLTHIEVGVPIMDGNERVGSIHVLSSLRPMYEKMAWGVGSLVAAMLGGLLIVAALIARFHVVITGPIADLAGLMDRVSSGKDYALRSDYRSKDELGTLAREFNDMLAQVQARDAALEQHRAHLEQEVALRTARLTEAQRIALLGNWEWDIVNDTLSWSDEIYRIFGLEPQQFEATFKAFMQAVHPEDRQLVEDGVRKALEEGRPYSLEHRILLPDGMVRYVYEQAEEIRGEDGQPIRMLGTVQDITERILAEQNLRWKTAFFEALVNTSADGIIVVDAQGRKVLQNPRAIELWKIPDDVAADPDDNRQIEFVMSRVVDPRAFADRVGYLYAHPEEQSQDEIVVKDGTILERYSAPVLGSDGHPYGRIWSFRDITGRKRAEEQLRESEARYRGIFEYAEDIIYLLEPDGTFRSLSPAFEKITGWGVEEWIGKPFAPIIHPDDLPHANAIFLSTMSGESVPSFRLRIARKSGVYFDADLSITPLGRNPVAGALGIARDVTERQRAEEQIRKLNDELESKVQERTRQLLDAQEELVRKEKLAVLGQVAGSVGHELRNPLGVMSNAVYFLQTVLSDADATTKEYLGIIKGEIAASERIVSDLLDSVRTKLPQAGMVGVRQLVEQVLGKLTVPPSVAVTLDIPDTLPPVQVDAMQIHQVFRNLISNGMEAMPEGGTLEIRAVEAGDRVSIDVCDTGVGIAPEQLGNLFQPLFTTKARGIGLGLVVVKNLTEANGGKVEVQSEVGKGTTFTVTLPAAPSSAGEC
jgi:PAS domain S-box-containing protein